MNNLKKEILEKIKTGQVKKKSRWLFLSKKYSLWIFSILSLLFGAMSFSIFLHNYFDEFGPWYKLKLETSFWFSNIFWIWLILFLLLIISAILNFRQTKKAFKFKISLIILTILSFTLVLGFSFYKLKVGKILDRRILNNSKSYQDLKIEKQKWIFDYLEKNNIDPKEFFENDKIIQLKEKYKEIDQKRIDRLKNILEKAKKNNNKTEIKELKDVFERIKIKKREIDYLRFMKELEIYQKI